MSTSHVIHFGPLSLDPPNACLWQGTQPLTLWPKDFAVLHDYSVAFQLIGDASRLHEV
jgi:hypothetical protein